MYDKFFVSSLSLSLHHFVISGRRCVQQKFHWAYGLSLQSGECFVRGGNVSDRLRWRLVSLGLGCSSQSFVCWWCVCAFGSLFRWNGCTSAAAGVTTIDSTTGVGGAAEFSFGCWKLKTNIFLQNSKLRLPRLLFKALFLWLTFW